MKKIFTLGMYIGLVLVGCVTSTSTYADEKGFYEKGEHIFKNEKGYESEDIPHITQDLVITGVHATSTGAFSSLITIDTSTLAKVRVIYWATNAGVEKAEVQKSHIFGATNEITLSDLMPDTFYSYYVITKDHQGNIIISSIQSFLTESIGGGHDNL